MATDIRDARFYVIDESDTTLAEDSRPLGFEEAFDRATALADAGESIKVLYTDEASQTEIKRFVSHGIRTELAGAG